MNLVILESPYAGDVERNVRYARACMRDCFLRGEAPYASHLLYTQEGVLDDNNMAEREQGIEAGLLWGKAASATVVYMDLGLTDGMRHGILNATTAGRPIEYRTLGGEWKKAGAKGNLEQRIYNVLFDYPYNDEYEIDSTYVYGRMEDIARGIVQAAEDWKKEMDEE